MGSWPVTWTQAAFTLAELALIHDYQQQTTMEES